MELRPMVTMICSPQFGVILNVLCLGRIHSAHTADDILILQELKCCLFDLQFTAGMKCFHFGYLKVEQRFWLRGVCIVSSMFSSLPWRTTSSIHISLHMVQHVSQSVFDHSSPAHVTHLKVIKQWLRESFKIIWRKLGILKGMKLSPAGT